MLKLFSDHHVSSIRCSTIKVALRKRSALGISDLTRKHLKSVKQLAISYHPLECNCSIDFDHFDILPSDANKLRLLINPIPGGGGGILPSYPEGYGKFA